MKELETHYDKKEYFETLAKFILKKNETFQCTLNKKDRACQSLGNVYQESPFLKELRIKIEEQAYQEMANAELEYEMARAKLLSQIKARQSF